MVTLAFMLKEMQDNSTSGLESSSCSPKLPVLCLEHIYYSTALTVVAYLTSKYSFYFIQAIISETFGAFILVLVYLTQTE